MMHLLQTATITAFLTSAFVANAQEVALPLSTTELLAMLESGAIQAGGSDAWLASGQPNMSVIRDGSNTAYSFPGLDPSTDRISLISHDGRLFYAHFESCSDSETFFKKRSRYFRYLVQSRYGFRSKRAQGVCPSRNHQCG
jgi:hypothetical protein